MKKVKTKYMLGEHRNLPYRQIAHNKGAIIWIFKNKIRTHISEGKISDFHSCLFKNCDDSWRGRATKWEKGIITVLMPTSAHVSQKFSIPEKVIKSIKTIFKPILVLVDTKEGLRVLEKIRQKSKNTDRIGHQ